MMQESGVQNCGDETGLVPSSEPRLWRGKFRACPAKGGIPSSEGSALLMALWAIAILSLFVGSFAFDAHIEARLTSYRRKRTKAEFLAKSGIEIAELLMDKTAQARQVAEADVATFEAEDRWFATARNLAEGVPVQGLVEALGDGTIILDIAPEPARRNINKLGSNDSEREQALERILGVGGVPEDLWPELVESFLDWTDGDDERRVDGAETDDHYALLDAPYHAKNGPVDTVGELLLIKGFTKTILYGGNLATDPDDPDPETIPGIADLLTVYGEKDGRIDINAASERVLMTLPDVDELVAKAIIEERSGWVDDEGESNPEPFKNAGDVFTRIPELDRSALQKYVTTGSAVYRITAIGEVGGVRRKVWCTASHAGKGKGLTILRWREDD